MKTHRPLLGSFFLFSLATFAVLRHAPAAPDVPTSRSAAKDAAFQPWVSRGVIITPGFAGPRSSYIVSAPCVIKLKNGRLRMYFWAWDTPSAHGTRLIYAAEATPDNPFQWELVSPEPVLGPDPSGKIRDRGVGFPYVLPRDDAPWLMYYAAWGSWAPPGELPTRMGLAISHDEGMTWEVHKETVLPLGEPGSHDAGLTGGMSVLRTGKNDYLMWYTAGERYLRFPGTNRAIAHTGMAHSHDGIVWNKVKRPVISPRLGAVDPFEAVAARPVVVRIDGVYHMWLGVYRMWHGAVPSPAVKDRSRKNDDDSKLEPLGYRIEYARSTDGISWHREADKTVLTLTPGGFDSKHQSYPSVIDMGKQLWMFYAGNDFGTTGIGLATIDKVYIH